MNKDKIIEISDERKDELKERIIHFFETEREETMGIIGAQQILDFMLKELGSSFYNQGVQDATVRLKSRMEDLEYDLEDLIL